MNVALAVMTVALGGALGALGRYGLGQWLNGFMVSYASIMTVNVIGSFLMGVAYAVFDRLLVSDGSIGAEHKEAWRLLISTGFLGALTTFSTFSLENYLLMRQGDYVTLLVHSVGSVVLCLVALILGVQLVSLLMR